MSEVKHRKVKITTDGTPGGCTVTDLETGKELRCTRVEFEQEWSPTMTLGRAKLTVVLTKLEFEGLAELRLSEEHDHADNSGHIHTEREAARD